MLLMEKLAIAPADTTGRLHDQLAALGGRLVVQALDLAAAGALQPVKQPDSGITYAHKIEKAEAVLAWQQPAVLLERRIRAFNPFPGASTLLGNEVIKVWRAELAQPAVPSGGNAAASPGTVLQASPAGITVQTGDGTLTLTELQRAGGKRLPAGDFLHGFALQPGQVLGSFQPHAPHCVSSLPPGDRRPPGGGPAAG